MSFVDILRKTPHRLSTLVEVSSDNFATVDHAYTNGSVAGAEARLLSAGDVELATASNGGPASPSVTLRLDNSDGALTWTTDIGYVFSSRVRVSMVATDGATTETHEVGTFRVAEPPRHGTAEVELVAFFDWAALPPLDLPTIADLIATPATDCYYQNGSGVWAQVWDGTGFDEPGRFEFAIWPQTLSEEKKASTQVPLWFGAEWHETLPHAFQRNRSGDLSALIVPLFTTIRDPRTSTDDFDAGLRVRCALSVPDAPGALIAADVDPSTPEAGWFLPGFGTVTESAINTHTEVAVIAKGAVTYYVVYARIGFAAITRPVANLSGFLRTGDAQWKKEPGSIWAAALFAPLGLIVAAPFFDGDYKTVRSTYRGPTQEPTSPNDERLTPLVGGLQQLGFNVQEVLSLLYTATTVVNGAWRVISIHVKHGYCSASDVDRGHPVEVLEDLADYYGGAFTVEPALAEAVVEATPFAGVTFQISGEATLRDLLHQLTYPFGIVSAARGGELLLSTSRMDPSGAYLFAAPVDAEESHLLSVALPTAGELFAPFERIRVIGDSLSTPDMLASAAESYAAAKARLEDAKLLEELSATGVPGSGEREVDVSVVDFPLRRAVVEQAAQLWPQGLERIEFAAAPWLIGIEPFSFLSMRVHRDGGWVDVRVYLTGKRIDFDNNAIIGIGYVVAASLPVSYQMIDESSLKVAAAGDLTVGTAFRANSSGELIAQTGASFPSVPVGSLVSLMPQVGVSISNTVANLGAVGYRNFGVYRVKVTWHDVGGLQALTLEHLQDSVKPEEFATSGVEYLYDDSAASSVRFYLNAPAAAPTGAVCNAVDEYDFDGSPATEMKDG